MAKIWEINLYYCIIIILFSQYCISDDYTCSPKTECLCEFSNHNVLDISSINTSFRRNDIIYYFNGCNSVSNLSGCDHAKLCKYNTSTNHGESLGNNLTFTVFKGQPGAYNISLNFKNNTANITSTITLVCTSGLNYTVFTDIPGSNNSFYLFSPSACMIVHHNTGGLSTGSVLLLLLFLGCVFYFVGGAIVLHCIRGARGKEMIPNIDFWQNLPGLVKDGLIFAFNGCRPTAVTTADSYDRI